MPAVEGAAFSAGRHRRGCRAKFFFDQRGELVSAFLEEGSELVDLMGECRECVPVQKGAVVRPAAVLGGGPVVWRAGRFGDVHGSFEEFEVRQEIASLDELIELIAGPLVDFGSLLVRGDKGFLV